MSVQEIIQAVQTVGFPIVMCGVLCWLVYDMQRKHKDEVDKLTTALNNNTAAILTLTERIGGKENE